MARPLCLSTHFIVVAAAYMAVSVTVAAGNGHPAGGRTITPQQFAALRPDAIHRLPSGVRSTFPARVIAHASLLITARF